jgi:hypothetical protein
MSAAELTVTVAMAVSRPNLVSRHFSGNTVLGERKNGMGNQGGGGDHHPLKVIVAGRIRGGGGVPAQ